MNYGRNWWSSRGRDKEQGDLFDDDPYSKKETKSYSTWGNQYTPKTGYGYYRHSFYNKPDIINPTLHWVDEDRVKLNIIKAVENPKSVNDILNIIANTPLSDQYLRGRIINLIKSDTVTVLKEVKKQYHKIPEHIKNDIFKMYYHSTVKLDYAERVDSNISDYEYIDAAINPVAKVMTEGSNLKSLMFTKDIIIYFAVIKALEELLKNNSTKKNSNDDDEDEDEDEDDEQNDKENNKENENNHDANQNGTGNVTQAGNQKIKFDLKNDFERNALENVIEQTKKVCANLDNIVTKEMQNLLYQGELPIENLSITDINADVLKEIEKSLFNMEMNTKKLKEKLNKLLDRSTSNFSSQKKTEFKDIFSADDFSMLDEYELLHPKLRKIMMEDIMIPEHKYMGKLDIYLDISGSMSSSSGVIMNGKTPKEKNLSKCDLGKMIVYKLYKMGILNNFYIFEQHVTKVDASPISIATLTPKGGTSIDVVVNHVKREKQNAIIITDAEDYCSIYSSNAFFLGVRGSNFRHFDAHVLKLYSEKSQMIIYDGDHIHEVNEFGC